MKIETYGIDPLMMVKNRPTLLHTLCIQKWFPRKNIPTISISRKHFFRNVGCERKFDQFIKTCVTWLSNSSTAIDSYRNLFAEFSSVQFLFLAYFFICLTTTFRLLIPMRQKQWMEGLISQERVDFAFSNLIQFRFFSHLLKSNWSDKINYNLVFLIKLISFTVCAVFFKEFFFTFTWIEQ